MSGTGNNGRQPMNGKPRCGDFGGRNRDGSPCRRYVRNKRCSSHLVSLRKREMFLAAMAETGNITRSAEITGIDRRTHYDWLRDDPEYEPRFEEAKKRANDRLEEEARRRAVDGLRRLKFHKGEPIIDPETKEPYFEHEYSDTLLIFLMKGNDPEKYRDNIHHSGQVGLTLADAFTQLRKRQEALHGLN